MEKIMLQVNAWIDQLAETAIYMDIIAKALGAVVGFFVIWLILRRLLRLVEKRIQRFDFFRTHGDTIKILHTCFVLVLVLATGTYLIRLFHLALV
ncbi:MAG: hypothetical protein JRH15_16390, partial [Deltaproteobacteria bacterium]|nr:hypothetical protein [Deltaproteobacteria bacterium]